MRLDLTMRRCYDPFSTAIILGSVAGGFGVSKIIESQKNQAAKASGAESATNDATQKQEAEQKALQDTQEEDKKKAAARLALSTSGFSRETSTARSFLTTL